jgi:hypothetical protein
MLVKCVSDENAEKLDKESLIYSLMDYLYIGNIYIARQTILKEQLKVGICSSICPCPCHSKTLLDIMFASTSHIYTSVHVNLITR